MSFLKNFDLSLNSMLFNRIKNWDSRKYCIQDKLNKTEIRSLMEFIEKLDSYEEYQKCFINYTFITQLSNSLTTKKLFDNCELEITDLINCSNFLKYNSFKYCTFYIPECNLTTNITSLDAELIKILKSNNNVLVQKSYIEYLGEKLNGDLNLVPKELLEGLTLNFSNLEQCILPKEKNFFQNMTSLYFHNIKFSNVDFNKYNTTRCKFLMCTFDDDCILSNEMLCNSLIECILPPINFNIYYNNDYPRFSFIDCTFNKNTKFPKYKNFFNECTIRDCIMPPYDYSDYEVNPNIFNKCSFSEDSTLPKGIFTQNNIKILDNLLAIPSTYLKTYIMFGEIKDPYKFLEHNKLRLNAENMFLLHKKYCI